MQWLNLANHSSATTHKLSSKWLKFYKLPATNICHCRFSFVFCLRWLAVIEEEKSVNISSVGAVALCYGHITISTEKGHLSPILRQKPLHWSTEKLIILIKSPELLDVPNFIKIRSSVSSPQMDKIVGYHRFSSFFYRTQPTPCAPPPVLDTNRRGLVRGCAICKSRLCVNITQFGEFSNNP